MAVYKIPEPKPEKTESLSKPKPYTPPRPSVTLPCSKTMTQNCKVGSDVEICIRGKVKAVESREGSRYSFEENDPKNEVTVSLHEVEMADSDFEEMEKD